MSEYQIYEFVAIDSPLSARQMAELRKISTRAEISPTRFRNEYHWGDLKARSSDLMERYFDGHRYLANWGTHQLMLRIPKARIDLQALTPFFVGECSAKLTDVGKHLLLDVTSDTDEPDYEEGNSNSLDALIGIRAELMRGDFRPAYLIWLHTVAAEDLDDDVKEPPVPPCLSELSQAQQELAEFLRIDVDLISAAAKSSPSMSLDRDSLRVWVAALSDEEKEAWLLRALDEPELPLGELLLRAFHITNQEDQPGELRTVGELRDLAKVCRAERRNGMAARASKRKASVAAARKGQLADLYRDLDGA